LTKGRKKRKQTQKNTTFGAIEQEKYLIKRNLEMRLKRKASLKLKANIGEGTWSVDKRGFGTTQEQGSG